MKRRDFLKLTAISRRFGLCGIVQYIIALVIFTGSLLGPLGCATSTKVVCPVDSKEEHKNEKNENSGFITICGNEDGNLNAIFEHTKFKLGLLADSHFQTTKSLNFVAGQKGRTEDSLVASALRPAGLNYLSPLMVEYFLDKLIKEKVDVILYLGDGANNGCSDELAQIIELLKTKREESKIPLFYLLGNHDYLGAGNTDKWDERLRLCDDSTLTMERFEIKKIGDFQGNDGILMAEPLMSIIQRSRVNWPLTKFEVMEKLRQFNAGNEKYYDNLNGEHFKEVKKHCVKKGPNTEEHNKEECFLAGKASITDKELLLLDTSNYRKDLPENTILKVENYVSRKLGTEYYGDLGYITKKQMSWFEENLSGSPKEVILASHYPLSGFGLAWPEKDQIVSDLCSKVLPEQQYGKSRVLWVSAHTHKASTISKEMCPDGRTIYMLNIGSTLDYDKKNSYEPHAMVVGISESEPLTVKPVFPPDIKRTCGKIITMAVEEHMDHLQDYLRAGDRNNGCTLLGLNRYYADKNLEEMVQPLLGFENYQRHEDIVSVLNLVKFANLAIADNTVFDNFKQDDLLFDQKGKRKSAELFGICLGTFSSKLEMSSDYEEETCRKRKLKVPSLHPYGLNE